MTPEEIEAGACKIITNYFKDNPKDKLSMRQRHMLKLELKSHISRWRGSVPTVEDIPIHKLQLPDLVRWVKKQEIV